MGFSPEKRCDMSHDADTLFQSFASGISCFDKDETVSVGPWENKEQNGLLTDRITNIWPRSYNSLQVRFKGIRFPVCRTDHKLVYKEICDVVGWLEDNAISVKVIGYSLGEGGNFFKGIISSSELFLQMYYFFWNYFFRCSVSLGNYFLRCITFLGSYVFSRTSCLDELDLYGNGFLEVLILWGTISSVVPGLYGNFSAEVLLL